MSYDAERIAITNWLRAQDYFEIDPFADDGAPSKDLEPGGGYMELIPGRGAQISTGAPGANLHRYAGVLSITYVTEGRHGSRPGRRKADEIIDAMTGLKIDETGEVVDGASTVIIDFGPNGQVPYIAESRPENPFHRTVVNAAFTRTERR